MKFLEIFQKISKIISKNIENYCGEFGGIFPKIHR